jgi:hypothetical protein
LLMRWRRICEIYRYENAETITVTMSVIASTMMVLRNIIGRSS